MVKLPSASFAPTVPLIAAAPLPLTIVKARFSPLSELTAPEKSTVPLPDVRVIPAPITAAPLISIDAGSADPGL